MSKYIEELMSPQLMIAVYGFIAFIVALYLLSVVYVFIDAKRRERLAKGSGTTMAEVNKLMKQFEDTRKMMKAVAGGNMKIPKLPGRGFRR